MIKSILISATTAVAVGAPLYLAGEWSGVKQGRVEARLEAADEALNRMERMERNNEEFFDLSKRDRCIVFMRDSGLPIERCNER